MELNLDLSEIEAIIRESDEQRQQLTRGVGMSTVALFAVFDSKDGDVLKLVGTGTLAVVGDFHYVLTAAHVWEVIESAVKMGITLREDVDHRCLIDVKTIIPVGPQKPIIWNEWGPDIILLRIPREHV